MAPGSSVLKREIFWGNIYKTFLKVQKRTFNLEQKSLYDKHRGSYVENKKSRSNFWRKRKQQNWRLYLGGGGANRYKIEKFQFLNISLLDFENKFKSIVIRRRLSAKK